MFHEAVTTVSEAGAMFDKILIANRGEIAVRIARTLRRMGIRSVAVYSDADAEAPHVRAADEAVRIGPAAAGESYLAVDRLVEAATMVSAQAVHPGYGFLSENPSFARACVEAGLVFIGPPAAAVEAMGDKIRAKRTVEAAGVPVVPGRAEAGMTDDDLISAATEIGFPVLLKPSAGGGGKGMRMVDEPGALAAAISSARREAQGAFGDDTLLIERFVAQPRHIEIQVLADTAGTVIHLGERECSLQRRHQKIVEEAPSVLLDETTRERMGQAAVDAARSCGYLGAGTVEFIVSSARPSEFFFMEMNTRLQVEHPVTELVTGVDLVEQQVRVAAGEGLSITDTSPRGHAVEARIYAEDPAHDFLPTGGEVLALREPTSLLRVDSGIDRGTVVSSDYDPMLAKYVAYGPDRAQALARLRSGLTDAAVLGVGTNIGFLRRLLSERDVVAGDLDTELVERKLGELARDAPEPGEDADLPRHVLVAAAMERLLALEPGACATGVPSSPWDIPGGWRVGEPAWERWQVQATTGVGEPVTISVMGRAAGAQVLVADTATDSPDARSWPDPIDASASWEGETLVVRHSGRVWRYACARADGTVWLGRGGDAFSLTQRSRLAAARTATGPAGGGELVSPMPGTVLALPAREGERVTASAPVVVVEAMKMEHAVTAGIDGVVTKLHVRVGDRVALGRSLATVTPAEELGFEAEDKS